MHETIRMLPAGRLGLAAVRRRGLRRPHDRRDQIGIGGGPGPEAGSGARDMRVDIGRGQPDAEIRRQRPLRRGGPEHPVEHEIAGDLAVVRMLQNHRIGVMSVDGGTGSRVIVLASLKSHSGSGGLPARAASSSLMRTLQQSLGLASV